MLQAAGFAWNHFRNSFEGAISRSQSLTAAFSFVSPRGHKRSTSTRTPSAAETASYTRLTTTSIAFRIILPLSHFYELLETDFLLARRLRGDTYLFRAGGLRGRAPQV